MGDFVTVGVMGGQQIASVGKIDQDADRRYLQFPPAAANAVILLATVLLMIWGADPARRHPQGAVSDARGPRPARVLLARRPVFALFVLFLYGPMITIVVLSFQGPEGGLTFPMHGVSTALVRASCGADGLLGRHLGGVRPLGSGSASS